MKVYIAGRARKRIDEIRDIIAGFKSNGYQVTYDWTLNDSKLVKPYRSNKDDPANVNHQKKSLKGAANADIFVLLDDAGLRGAYIELGAFLSDALKRPKGRQAFIVGKGSHKRQHVFECNELVKLRDSIEGVYKDLGLTELNLKS